MFCPSCGTNIPEGARFCPSCGSAAPAQAPVAAQAPAPPPPPPAVTAPPVAQACPSCGSAIAPGRRFCTNCGYSFSGGAPAPAARGQVRVGQAGARTASASLQSLAPLQLGALGGLALAAISTLLAWLKVSQGVVSESRGAWSSDIYDDLRIGDWVGGGFPADAIVVVAFAGLAAYLVLAPLLGQTVPAIPYALLFPGFGLMGVGILNYLHIKSQIDDLGAGDAASVGIGVYLLIAGGAIAAVSSFMYEQQKLKAG